MKILGAFTPPANAMRGREKRNFTDFMRLRHLSRVPAAFLLPPQSHAQPSEVLGGQTIRQQHNPFDGPAIGPLHLHYR
jgi:hypothetical protein